MKTRVFIFQIFVFVLFVGVIARVAQVQLFPDERLVRNRQAFYKTEVMHFANRGAIFDRTGHPLAVSAQRYSIFAHPHQVVSPREAAQFLTKPLNMTVARLTELLQSDRSFVWLKRKVPVEVKNTVMETELAGVNFLVEQDRVYPNGTLGAHVLGFTNIDLKGMTGIEARYDKALVGIPRSVEVLKDARGRIIYIGRSASTESRAGYNLTLSVDQNIQFIVEQELEQIVKTYSAAAAMAIAMDPRDGQILAMGIHPTFDPNTPGNRAIQFGRNRLVSDFYEPGSTMKPFTLGASLAQKNTPLNKKYDCEGGRLRIGRRLITDVRKFEILPFDEILKVSSNVCAVKVAQELGGAGLREFLSMMGFGELTGIDLPAEVGGLLPPLSAWREINLATISYGHGIAVTPIQLVRAFAVFANSGFLVQPHVLLKVEDEFGNLIYDNAHVDRKRVVSDEAAQKMRQMLIKVTGEGGTAPLAAPFGLPIPGKTGTAYKYDEAIGGYDKEAFMSSFIGMFPPESPRVVLLIVVDDPKDKYYAATVAGPAFRNMSEKIIGRLSLYPQTKMAAATTAPTTQRAPAAAAAKTPVPSRIQIPLYREDRIPDLKGYSLAEAQRVAKTYRWLLTYEGVGKVVSQTPQPGALWQNDQLIHVVLTPD